MWGLSLITHLGARRRHVSRLFTDVSDMLFLMRVSRFNFLPPTPHMPSEVLFTLQISFSEESQTGDAQDLKPASLGLISGSATHKRP